MSATTEPAARILVVEDSDTQALQVRRLLEGGGFEVARAASAEAALEALNGALPDLIIADYHLPGMNGDELSRQVKLNTRTRRVPVLMLTEGREQGLERQGLESGADAYVPKSAGLDLLLLRVRALLRGRPAPAGEAAGEAGAFTALRRARLLVVDDSATSRLWLARLLSDSGYAVEMAAGPAEALAAIGGSEAAWDCVLVRVMGAGFDGFELCRRLAALRSGTGPSGGEAPFFQIAAIGGDDPPPRALLAEAFEAGADDLLPATAGADVLGVRIRAIARRKLLQDENRRLEAETRQHALEVARARAEAAAAAARASLAEALAQANAELAAKNRQIVEAQAQLVQAAKLASLGELVAGIAHEINNPLAFILAHQGTAERLLGRLEPAVQDRPEAAATLGKCRERIRSTTLGLQRIQDLVLKLRRFSRLDDGGFQDVDVPEAVETVLTLLGNKIGDRITVTRDYRAGRLLHCSPALLNQVVMNIIGNSLDAIEGAGTIAIATRSDADRYVIEIADSGPGVPAELRERVFEPFFTTKPVGAGTGLGLSIAYSVVRSHEGTIAVDQAPLGGARFTIAVPLRRPQESTAA
ncbi:response regulator [Belnapia sp. T6]|uniref:histidine kinase n=1 Tax=Belnapia mucosa TaxID=2804532 RepID=A0ABS1V1Z1_9PROT|nr:response regulator [Belnapia mucosa]MBL6455715.1 response regulator [Belnapia mucosa]